VPPPIESFDDRSTTSQPHIIRLRGPWRFEPKSRWQFESDGTWHPSTQELPSAGQMTLPGNWQEVLGSNYAGTVQFSRFFRCPDSVALASRVHLWIEEVDWEAAVILNDQLLGVVICSRAAEITSRTRCPARFEITKQLRPSNTLTLLLTAPALTQDGSPQYTGDPVGGQIGLVRLEIE
jgi:hypothetical protein